MYNYAHQKIQEFQAIPASDNKLYFYLPSSYTGKQCEMSLRVGDPFDFTLMKYKVKEVQTLEHEINQLMEQEIIHSTKQISKPMKDIVPKQPRLPTTQKKQQNLLTQKYTPKTFSDLLSDDKINREVLTWLKAWEHKQKPGQQINQLFKKTLTNVYQFESALGQGLDLSNQVILLAGPPGTGKTTLARVIAAMCNYQCIEINASDERNSENLISRIEMMCNNTNISQSNKKTLVILDEVDGALESESQGAIDKLLQYIFFGKTATKPTKKKPLFSNKIDKKDKFDKDDKTKPEDEEIIIIQPTTKIYIKRPVIFICNDPYAKGLKELRKKAIVFYFKRYQQDNRLIMRLKFICKKEKIVIDDQTLIKICAANDYDIRACLGALQMIALGENQEIFTLSYTKSIFQLLSDVFYTNDKLQQTTYQFMHNLSTQIETSLLLDGTFQNYLTVKSTSKKFELIPDFLNYLTMADILEKNKLKYNFELTKFTTLPQLFFSLKLKSQEKSSITYPFQSIEFRRKKKLCEDIIDSLTLNVQNTSLRNKKNYSSQITSYLFQIIQPKSQITIMTPNEQKELIISLSIMLAFNLQVLAYPLQVPLSETQSVEINFTPQIERLIMFTDIPLNKTINEKSRMLMNKWMPIVKTNMIFRGAGQKDKKDNDYLEKYDQIASKRKKFAGPDEDHRKIIFRFQEGQSTPILYPLKMSFFFQ